MKRIHVLPALLVFATLFLYSCTKEEILNNKVPVAIAGDSLTVELGQEGFVTLTGSGRDSDGEIVAYLWSQVSGPNEAVIVNAGSAVTEVTNLITGQYVFQLMVVDDDGATGVDNIVVSVKITENNSSFKPANNPYEVFVVGYVGGNDITDHNAPEIAALAWTIGSPIAGRIALKFDDLKNIPANATIESAKLYLFSNPKPLNGNLITPNFGTNNSMFVQKITTDWIGSAVRWNNQPGITDENRVSIPHTDSSSLDIEVDVTELIKGMTGTNANYGFEIRLQNESYYNSRIFCSSKNEDDTKHPRLEVVWKN